LNKESNDKVLVIGSGPAGLRAAMDLAELGIHVLLVEKRGELGGGSNKMEISFPSPRLHSDRAGPWTYDRIL